jgi:hypothetical protein
MKTAFIITTLLVAVIVLLIIFGKNNNDLGGGFYLEHSDIGELELYYPDSIKRFINSVVSYKYNKDFIVVNYYGTKNELDTMINIKNIDTTDKLSKDRFSFVSKYKRNLSIPKEFVYDKTYLYDIIHKYPFYYYGAYYKEEYLQAMKILKLPEELIIEENQ